MKISSLEELEVFLINQIQERKNIISNILPTNVGINALEFDNITEQYSNYFFIKVLDEFQNWKLTNENKEFSDFIFDFINNKTYDGQKIHDNDIKDFQYLLKNLDLKMKNKNGQTLLQLACFWNNIEMIKILLCEASLDMTIENNNNIFSSFCHAVRNGNLDIVKLLISYGVNIEKNLGSLQIAITNNNINMTKWLIEHGANVNYTNTSLHSPLHRAVLHNYIEIVKLLLKHNPDLNIKDNGYHMTPLSLSVFKNHQEITSILNEYISKQNNDIEINNLQQFITEPINAIDLENQTSTSSGYTIPHNSPKM